MRTRNDQYWRDFKEFREEVYKMIEVSKDEYQRNFFNVEDPKLQWKRIEDNSKIKAGKTSSNIILQTDEGQVKEPGRVATIFNEYFKSKVEKLQMRTNPNPKASAEYTRRFLEGKDVGFLSFRNTDYVEVIEMIRSLKNTNACGIDGITTKVLKKFDVLLAPPISHVINLIITQSKWPQLWKVGIISPVPKKNDLTQASNWRPVVLNNVMSKIAEKIINKQLNHHLESRNLLSQTQHTYRSGRSCSSAWHDIDSFISTGLAEGKILTDQSAAFNVLMAEILEEKLPLYGLSADSMRMIMSYLWGRSTLCQFAGVRSALVRISFGVPEGSILGPCLYTLAQMCVPVVKDMVKEIALEEDQKAVVEEKLDSPTDISTGSAEYADDVTGLVQARTEDDFQKLTNIFMEQYQFYFGLCGLALNNSVVVFRPGKKTKTIAMVGQDEVEDIKLLGLSLDNTYSFAKHASKTKSTAEFRLRF